MVLAAVGKNATGKDYFLEYISKKYNLPMFSIGDIARELAELEGLEKTRENLHYISEKYMKENGNDFFPKQIIKKINDSSIKNVLISGIRPLSDVRTFKNTFGNKFFLVDIVVSDDRLRFERMKSRNSKRDPKSFAELLDHDKHEEILFQISITEKMADYIIKNDGSADDFHKSADEFFKEFAEKHLD